MGEQSQHVFMPHDFQKLLSNPWKGCVNITGLDVQEERKGHQIDVNNLIPKIDNKRLGWCIYYTTDVNKHVLMPCGVLIISGGSVGCNRDTISDMLEKAIESSAAKKSFH